MGADLDRVLLARCTLASLRLDPDGKARLAHPAQHNQPPLASPQQQRAAPDVLPVLQNTYPRMAAACFLATNTRFPPQRSPRFSPSDISHTSATPRPGRVYILILLTNLRTSVSSLHRRLTQFAITIIPRPTPARNPAKPAGGYPQSSRPHVLVTSLNICHSNVTRLPSGKSVRDTLLLGSRYFSPLLQRTVARRVLWEHATCLVS